MRLTRGCLLLIYVAGFLRSLGVRLLGVVLALYLSRAGFGPTQIGSVIGFGLLGACVATAVVIVLVTAHRWCLYQCLRGLVMQRLAFSAPLVIGGTLKIAYDLLLYRSFRHVRPPEEVGVTPSSSAGIRVN